MYESGKLLNFHLKQIQREKHITLTWYNIIDPRRTVIAQLTDMTSQLKISQVKFGIVLFVQK